MWSICSRTPFPFAPQHRHWWLSRFLTWAFQTRVIHAVSSHSVEERQAACCREVAATLDALHRRKLWQNARRTCRKSSRDSRLCQNLAARTRRFPASYSAAFASNSIEIVFLPLLKRVELRLGLLLCDMPCDPNPVQVEGVPNVVNFPVEELSQPLPAFLLSVYGTRNAFSE